MSVVLKSVTHRYGPVAAVRNVTTEIVAGQVVGLVGPIGAGKSTLLRLIGALLPATAGEVLVNGVSTRTTPFEIRSRTGYVPQALPGWPDSRVAEYLRFRATLKNVPRRHLSAEVDRVLDACGLRPVRMRFIGRLSHGYQRRVSLADALLASPPLLLLDEPTAGLDATTASETCDLLGRLSQERTVIVSTHVLPEAERLCHRVLVLHRGQLVDDVLRQDWSHQGCDTELKAPVDDVQHWLTSHALTGTITPLEHGWLRLQSPQDCREQIGHTCHTRHWPLRLLTVRHPSLEERVIRSVVQTRTG